MESDAASKTLPRLQFAARSSGAIYFKSGPPDVTDNEQFPKYPASVSFAYSNKDGKLVAVITAQNVVIHDSDTGAVIHTLAQPGVAKIMFSPKNTFLLTWERWTKDKQASNKGNLIVWNLKTGTQVVSFVQKTVDDETWPPIRWTDDEAIAARMVSTEIQFFVEGQWERSSHVLKVPGVTHFSFAPQSSPPVVAAFVPAKAGKPGSVKIYRYPNFDRCLTSKTFFNATSVEFNWNSTGTAVLAKTRSDVDKSNKSYYGESGICCLSVDGTQVQISLDKEGPIHETCWSPDGKQFVLIYGFMPAKVALFDNKCEKTADFYPAGAPRNTARWSPCGQVLCLGGFGNLSGYMDFWFVKKLRKLGEARAAYSAYCEWSPDSNYLMTAVLSPKMTVDNGIKIFKPDGTITYEQRIEKLYQVDWRPYPTALFPTPRISLPHGAVAEKKEPKPGLYRHPNFSDDGRQQAQEVQGPQKFTKDKQKERPEGYIPSKTAQKNKKRRDRKKKKAGQAAGNNAAGNNAAPSSPAQPTEQQQQTHNGSSAPPRQETNQDITKQIKAIKKKLRQIKDLKEKDPATLDVTQKEKIAREDDLQKQLAQLQQKLPPRT